MDELTSTKRARPSADAADSGVRRAVVELVRAAGFRPMDTGDGGQAWYKASGPDMHVMVSAAHRLDGAPEAPDWTAGRYGNHGGFVEVNGLTLERAIDATSLLRPPVRADGSLMESLYPSLEQAMDDLS